MSPTIFVVGATGTLGKALALDLRKIDWNVHTTVRDPASSAAKELASAGVKLFAGSWDDEAVLRDAIAGCEGLFLNLVPNFTDAEADVRQGKSLIAIAKAAGVKHVVHSTSITEPIAKRFEPDNPVAIFLNNKTAVENIARAAGFEAYTILRPATFMANWLAPKVYFMHPGVTETGTFKTGWRPDTVVPFVDEHDVAAFAIAAFKDPSRFRGQDIAVASGLYTAEETLKLLSQATGRQIKADYLSNEDLRTNYKDNPILQSQLETRTMSDHYDMDDIRKWGMPLHSFQEYLEREKAIVEQTYNQHQ
ncbi:hypothetical protein F5Y10DRAFT_290726 [Nemania abortiva]|nr:hypothetical protein F5Y10DRAFT_290726 [Nemania abortiva]